MWPYLFLAFVLGAAADAAVSVVLIRRWVVPTARRAQLLELEAMARSPAYADLSFAQVMALESWLRREPERDEP